MKMGKRKFAPITFAQLCVMARGILTADPSLDNFEWCERIKDQLVRAGFEYPERPEQIHEAMRAVERVVHRTPLRSVETPPPPAPDPPPETAEDRARFVRFWREAQAVVPRHTLRAPPGETRTPQQIAEWRASQPRASWQRTGQGWRNDRRIHGDGAGEAEGLDEGDQPAGRDQDADRGREPQD